MQHSCHSRFPSNSVTALLKNNTIGIINKFNGDVTYNNLIDIGDYIQLNEKQSIKITSFYFHTIYSHLLFCLTSNDTLLLFEIDKFNNPNVTTNTLIPILHSGIKQVCFILNLKLKIKIKYRIKFILQMVIMVLYIIYH